MECYRSLKNIFKGKFSLKMKKKIFKSNIQSVLTYGAQTWTTTARQRSSLTSTQMSMQRSMLGIKRKDRIRNEEITKKLRIKDCGYKINKLKFDYAGHVARREGGRWERRVLVWHP